MWVVVAVYVLGKRLLPRYAIVLVALSGFGMAMLSGQVQLDAFELAVDAEVGCFVSGLPDAAGGPRCCPLEQICRPS
ncbi:hypothetical protein QWA_18100 [Alcaligenes faecalis subsp. faecalis NCIB 8687]|nr:hypothetical protein QWA_18100 [Alcaligenes faecalis subsp. faecalis NCIB 8687]